MSTPITLVANSGLQFWDVDLVVADLPQTRRRFWEEQAAGQFDAQGTQKFLLREVDQDDDGHLTARLTKQPVSEDDSYEIGVRAALDMLVNRWVPLPFFHVIARDTTGHRKFAKGPTNWVRAWLTDHPTRPGLAWRMTLAFDTALLATTPGGAYVGLSPENGEGEHEFAFVAELDDNSWFIDERWMGDWLDEMLKERLVERRGGRALQKTDMPTPCAHYARYIVFLALLDATEKLPDIKLVGSTDTAQPMVDVDLVLDIGNSRSCGILIEQHPDESQNFANSYPLVLRDLSRPEFIYDKPFESRIEFVRASFGREALSRQSGRSSAFDWHSPVRVGPEAVRLAGARAGTEGATGLSSPKRYLWDERGSTQGWRFNGRSADGVTTDPPVAGPFMALVEENGRVIGGRPGRPPAMRARFSRSALFAFMLAEIVLQALGQINAPGNRMRRRDAGKPRRLRTLLMTMPPGMPVAEQRILAARAREALQLAWGMLGQAGRAMPVVKCELDEATATQIVWLHNEVSERLQGDVSSLMRMMGRIRPEVDPALPCLRLASLDIGGGTTDLMITTYTAVDTALTPRQDFRESFKIAGDDVLERVIVDCVLPAVQAALTQAGAGDARAVLMRALGQDQGGQSEQDRHLRRLFVNVVLEPLGLALLHAYENAAGRAGGEILRGRVGDLLGVPLDRLQRALAYLEPAALAAGATGFSMADVQIAGDARKMEAVISSVLAPMLADLCEVIWHYDCDVLLLSGRPSRLPVVTSLMLAKMPLPPHRVIGMHRYRVGERYPFRDSANRIDDPKTTAAVGAALCVQAEGRLRNFTLRTKPLRMKSTARIIGKMDNNGQIRKPNELLTNADLDAVGQADVTFTMNFDTATQLGFRQLAIERWTATPLYVLEFANPDNARALELPLRIEVKRFDTDPDRESYEVAEQFRIEQVTDAQGDQQPPRIVSLRLQTLNDQDGYWRDTGRLAVT